MEFFFAALLEKARTSVMKKIILITAALFCSANTGAAAEKLPVFVSILPQKYFVRQIGRELVDINVMVPPGASPATYEPKPRQMAAISKARIYFAIGVPFENAWLGKISAANPKMDVVHTDRNIEKIPISGHRHDEKDHHHGHEKNEAYQNEHGALDPHIWLSPPLVKIQARTILAVLQQADPSHKELYEANCKKFEAEIDALDSQLKQIFAGKNDLRFVVFHPSWGYFADAYGLKQVPIEVEGKAPKPAQLKNLIETVKAKKIKIIFVQPQFSTKSAKLVAREIGGHVAFADPLAEAWLSNLQEVAIKFRAAVK